MPDEGFRRLAQDPKTLELMARIEANVLDQENRTGPRTYACFQCHDKGVTFHVEHHQTFSDACGYCEFGAAVARGRAADRVKKTHAIPKNRLLPVTLLLSLW